MAPEFREYERASTTVADAYLGPVASRYLRSLGTASATAGLPEPLVMRSSGGVATVADAAAHPALILVSGPAGGVVGAERIAALAGCENAIAFDMGGTSTDVCLIAGGQAGRSAGREVAGFPVRLPMLDIHTVGAGGGSIVWRDEGGALRVGPRSAGADPGPACYGRGGTEPTVTDANLVLGRLPSLLPGGLQLDLDAAERALGDIDPAAVVDVVNAEMLRALRLVSVERGHDPRDFALIAFGGAGPLHACALADELGAATVLVPAAAGVLSALGLVASDERRDHVVSVVLPLSDVDELPSAGDASLRYRGQSFELDVALGDDLAERFHHAHETRYGYADQGARSSSWRSAPRRSCPGRCSTSLNRLRPAGVRASTGRVGSSWTARHAGCRRAGSARRARPERSAWSEPDDRCAIPVELQVIGSALRAVAEEMGAVLIRAASPRTSRNGVTARRRCSTPPGGWSSRQSTSPSTSGRCPRRWPP